MKLDKIVLNGFKSFADKTEFDFKENITAIVGPNGCGKSNVVDAVKWVLGDQSPKSLRSGQMADVIFSGSSSRKSSGMSQVNICFSDVRGLGLEQDELDIARRLYRSGESEYMINNKPCRLKDVRELFMDTGVGVKAYSIIEQGQIDQLLHASKTDRRVIFEEAAGISKYKAHKKEALRKLDRTEQNLLRLADIVTEIQKQLRSIKLQAGKARNYLQHSQRLKELRVNYSLAEYDKFVNQNKKQKTRLGQLEEKFGSVCALVSRNDALVSELGKTIIESEGQINRCDNSLVAARSKIEQQLERIKFLQSRVEELEQRKTNLTEQIGKFQGQAEELRKELNGCEAELRENEEFLAGKNEQLEVVTQQLTEVNSECCEIEADLADEKSGIIDIVRRTAQLHNEIQSMSTYRNSLAGQKDRLNGRASVAQQQLTELLTEKAQHQAKLTDINKVIDELQSSLEEKRGEVSQIEQKQKDANQQLAQAKESRSALTSEFRVLSDMETSQEGLSSSVKDILQSRNNDDDKFDYVEGIVADVISAEAEYAIAVEACLEGRTDALVINSTSSFLEDTEMIQGLRSRVNVICTDRIEPFVDCVDLSAHSGVLGRVVEFVNYDSKHASLAWKLLGKMILVESLDVAIAVSRLIGPGYRFVTVGGEVFHGCDQISVGPVGKAAGLISRKSRMRQLQTELAKLSLEITEIQQQLGENARHNEHLNKLCKDLRTAVYEANTEKLNTDSTLRSIEENVKRLSDEQPIIASEIDMLESQIKESVQRSYDSKQKLQELETINTQRTEHIAELENKLEGKRDAQRNLAEMVTELKIETSQAVEQGRSIRQRITSLQSQLQQGRVALESAKTEVLGCSTQTAETEREILKSEAKVSELYVEKEQAQRLSTEMHEKVEQLLGRQKEVEDLLKQERSEQSEVEQNMHHVQVELGQLDVKTEGLVQRIAEELSIDLAEAYENFEQQDVDWDEVRQEISELRSKIERLGNVNVDAIKEQEELEKRYEFLADQVEDLDKSKAQLEQLIAKINRQSREKFAVTFEEVRKNFQGLFRKMFGGGKADVLLEDPEDILESGIEIVARPPGKETRSISLLSGGEKTLTAMALLFAVFRSKPSPFCFLDEVDAALDEANNERFNMIVKEFQKDSQFVIITHSKRTMSIADILVGVTMQTQGVSKKISVKFDGADAETETAVA